MIKGSIGFAFILLCTFNTWAQDVELPLLYSLKTDYLYQSALNKDSLNYSYSPFYSDELSNSENIPFVHIDSSKSGTWVGRKLFRENFLILDQKNIYLTVDPLFNLVVGTDQSDPEGKSLYQNTRGVKIQGVLGDNFIFSTSFLENQARFPNYINDYVKNTGVVPGMGRVKNFKDGEYDYSMATASISYKINKNIRVKLGNDKDFLGLGYRSVILSDNAFNYPHLKIDFTFEEGKIRYTLNYALLQDLIRQEDGETPESLFERKFGSFHYLSFNPFKSFSLGLFAGSIFKNTPSSAEDYFAAFNPIIFINLFSNQTSYGRIGINSAWGIWTKGRVYAQFSSDMYGNERAWMTGLLLSDIFKGLDLTIEYSFGERISRSDSATISQKFSHYNQSLAHSLGSGFNELFFRVHYSILNIHLMASANFASRYVSDSNFWGFQDLSEFGSTYNSTNIITELFYMLNPKTNMNIALGYQFRRENLSNANTDYLYLSFRTSLFNEYRDF